MVNSRTGRVPDVETERIRLPEHVYPPREDTELLLPFASVPEGTWLLEIGCGAGLAALLAARRGAHVVATDLNPFAVRFVADAALREHLPLGAVLTDLARGLRSFDRILANPPYLPTTPEVRDADPWHNLALDGGPDGTTVLERIVATLPEHLLPGGEAFVVVSSRQSPQKIRRIFGEFSFRGGSALRVASRVLSFETLEVWRLCLEGIAVDLHPRRSAYATIASKKR